MKRLVVLAGLLVLIAGCAGSTPTASPAASSTTIAPAPAPTHDAATGAIEGTVTDDELSPVAGVRVSLIEIKAEQVSDKEGRFTFSALEPGSYRVVADSLGFESVAKKVNVVAGETTKVSLVIKAMVIAESHHLSLLRTSVIQASNSWGSIVANYSAVCGSCFHTLFFEPVPMQVLVENTWTATEVCPVLNCEVDIWWRYYDAGGGYHNNLDGYKNRESKYVPQTEVAELGAAKVDKFAIAVEGSGVGLSVQQRVETWHTFAYVENLPENFTALPPKS